MRFNKSGYYHQHDENFRIERPDGSGDYLLLFIRTSGFFQIHGVEYYTDPNTILLYKKDTPQLYSACGAPYADDWLHFQMDESDLQWITDLHIPFDTPVSVTEFHDLSMIVRDLTYESYSDSNYRDETLLLYLRLLFLKLSEKLHSAPARKNNIYYAKLSALRSKIYNMPYESWSMEKLSDTLALNKYYFQHLYKDTFGVTAMEDIIQSRTEHAKYLLSTTQITVHEVARMCGYNSDTHFIRQFRTQTGMTPSQYRTYATVN